MGDVRILIADRYHFCRVGLRTVLTSVPGWTVCAEAETGLEAVERTCALLPDVVVLSLNVSAPHALVATQRIRAAVPSVEVVIVAAHASPQLALEILRAGARGLVLRSDVDSTLVGAVATVQRHRTYLVRLTAQPVFEQSPVEPLSPREREIARLVASGKSNKEIAAMLGITPKTAETYRTRVMRKLELHSVVDLVHYAIRHGLIEIEW